MDWDSFSCLRDGAFMGTGQQQGKSEKWRGLGEGAKRDWESRKECPLAPLHPQSALVQSGVAPPLTTFRWTSLLFLGNQESQQ